MRWAAGLAGAIDALQSSAREPGAPRAHLNVLFFDEGMNLVPELSAVGVVPSGLLNWTHIEPVGQGNAICCGANGPGFVIVYVDNQAIGKDVWFDNISIEHYSASVIEENHYYPYGLTITSTGAGVTEQPYKYQTKELEKSFGLEIYDFVARQNDPQIGRFLSIDPLAAKFPNISPYASMGNNPVSYIDPDGREIKGVTKQDAQNFKTDIHLTLADKKFDGVRALIDVKGSTFKSIDAKALNTALDGVTLSADERAYVDMVTNTINSKDVHKIEYMTGANTSSEGATAFKDHMNGVQAGAGDAMVPNGQLSTSLVEGLGKEGFNVPTQNGSHSFISSSVTGNERASTSGHEVFGHGIPSAKGLSPSDNNANAIRVDNLIRRILEMPQRDGKDHGGYKEGHITDPQKLPLTK